MASGTLNLGISNQIEGKIDWNASTDTSSNSSYITATIYVRRTNNATTTGTWKGGMTIAGRNEQFSVYSAVSNSWVALLTFDTTKTHNSDGTGSCFISGQIQGPSGTSQASSNVYNSTTITLSTVTRTPYFESIQNFNDEENPTIRYSNPAGSGISALEACISLDGSAADVPYRSIPAGRFDSYTFNLTEAERNTLRKATTTSNSRTVRFYIRATFGSQQYLVHSNAIFSIVNADPTIAPTITDTNSTTVALTGNSAKLIRYYSNAKVTIGAKALKSATVKSQKVVCGGKSLTGDGTINAVDSGSFKFTVTDSRGNVTNSTVGVNFVNYVKLTCAMAGNYPDTNGNFDFTVKGNYFNDSFGAVNNTLNVYYRRKVRGGEYSSWASMPVTLKGNTYTATVSLSGLDYKESYIFQAYAVDKLATVETDETPIRAEPIFDWSETDFNLNVPLYMYGESVLRRNGDNNNIVLAATDSQDGIFLRPNGTGSSSGQLYVKPSGDLYVSGNIYPTKDVSASGAISAVGDISTSNGSLSGASASINGATTTKTLTVGGRQYGVNKVLWTGGWFMSSGHTANLSEGISKQPSGIVLVFSMYGDGAAQDWGWSAHFVPKGLIAQKPGLGMAFFRTGMATNFPAAKYLYINDTTVTGSDDNVGEVTNYGITFVNNSCVMRYVIGV